jgi:hypothetical protein
MFVMDTCLFNLLFLLFFYISRFRFLWHFFYHYYSFVFYPLIICLVFTITTLGVCTVLVVIVLCFLIGIAALHYRSYCRCWWYIFFCFVVLLAPLEIDYHRCCFLFLGLIFVIQFRIISRWFIYFVTKFCIVSGCFYYSFNCYCYFYFYFLQCIFFVLSDPCDGMWYSFVSVIQYVIL